MTAADAERFFAALTAVAEVLERELSDAAQTLYFDALADLSLDACLHALGQAVKHNRFMPRPSELRAIVEGGADAELVTEQAWQTYRDTAMQIGGYASPTFDDGALAATIVAVFGSWELSCWTELSPEMWTARRKEFGRVYLLKRQQGVKGPRQLVGYCDRDNFDRGFTRTLVPEPQLLPSTTRTLALPPSRDEWMARRQADEAAAAAAHAALVESVQRGLEAAIERRDAARAVATGAA